MKYWLMTGALTGIITYFNLPAAWILPAEKATAAWLAESKLQPLAPTKSESLINAGSLWGNHGAVVFAVRRPG